MKRFMALSVVAVAMLAFAMPSLAQQVFLNGNISATEATVYDSTGIPSCFDIGTASATVDGDLDVTGDMSVTGDITISTCSCEAVTTLAVTGAATLDGGLTMDTDKFTVANTSGNTAIGGTLAVTGATTLTGALAANSGITVDSTAFTVANTSGNVATTGTLTVTGATALNGGLAMDTDKFVVADTTGNTTIAGTLGVTGLTTATGGIVIPSGASPASTCTVGQVFIDTDQTVDTNCTTTADNSLCICTATNTWTALENN